MSIKLQFLSTADHGVTLEMMDGEEVGPVPDIILTPSSISQ